MENGDGRPSCQPKVRSQKTRAAWRGSGSSRRIQKPIAVARSAPARKSNWPRGHRVARGYEAQSGKRRKAANFVHAARPAKRPRAGADVTKTSPQTRSAGMIASFEFELETYCVNGYAAQANASVAPRR